MIFCCHCEPSFKFCFRLLLHRARPPEPENSGLPDDPAAVPTERVQQRLLPQVRRWIRPRPRAVPRRWIPTGIFYGGGYIGSL